MFTKQRHFIQDVVAHPDDDMPRLIYADWLEERGDPQGEFIRVQCELASIDPHDPRRADLESRELQLATAHGKRWAGPVRHGVRRWWFRRGMLEGIKIDAEQFLRTADQLLESTVIRRIEFSRAASLLDQLAASPWLARLIEVSLQHNFLGREGEQLRPRFSPHTPRYDSAAEARTAYESAVRGMQQSGAEQLRAFLAAPALANLRALSLEDNHFGDPVATILADSRQLNSLQSLNLRTNGISAEGVTRLAAAEHLSSLRHLVLGSCPNISHNYDEDWTGPLPRAVAPLLERLESLDMGSCGMTLDGVQELSSHPAPNLRRFAIERSMLLSPGWREDEPSFNVVTRSSLLEQLIELDLSSCYLEPEQIEQLMKSKGLAALTTLRINNNPLLPAGAHHLSEAPHLGHLVHLHMDGLGQSYEASFSRIQDDGAAALLASSRLPRLAALRLRRQGLTAETANAVAESPLTKQLYYLDLSRNQLGDEGAETLASLRPWPRLACLNLRHNNLSQSVKDQLRSRFGFRVVY